MSIKDNIDIAGLKTSLASRAWEELYPAKEETAPAIRRLLELGAAVVGKSRLSQFAEVENPTADWVDLHCPFNPRGDGYLNPEGSTSGGAAALAAYNWLDVSIGTDSKFNPFRPSSTQPY
jgi:Asp-tRNA(Asn)/Glu-tRNA(Gln) amidotransferase A subunit family amidase